MRFLGGGNGLVVDNMAGSLTTGLAAEIEGHPWLACEMFAEYLRGAATRFEDRDGYCLNAEFQSLIRAASTNRAEKNTWQHVLLTQNEPNREKDKIVKIWINQAASSHGLARGCLAAYPDLDLCISAKNPNSPVACIAPTFWAEPTDSSAAYAEWALSQAIERHVDVFLAQRGQMALGRLGVERFAKAGIRLALAGEPDTLDLLDDKVAFMRDLGDHPMVGRFWSITSPAQLDQVLVATASEGRNLAIKPRRGINGEGYWRLLRQGSPFQHLAMTSDRSIAASVYLDALREATGMGEACDLIAMDYLPGPEASVDMIIGDIGVLLASMRTKLDSNRQAITTANPLIGEAIDLAMRYELQGPINVQFRRNTFGTWQVLEINARLAGGAWYADAAGIPFSRILIDWLRGEARAYTEAVTRTVWTLPGATLLD